MIWTFRGGSVTIGARPLVMGIVNVTPDSFSDGGKFYASDSAVAHGLQLVAEGADFLDIGGESTRPGSIPVTLEDELQRVIPVARELAKQINIPISVDTTKAEVARQALDVGAAIVNDITAATDPLMIDVVRQYGAGLAIMHMQGTPQTMQLQPTYSNVIREVRDYLAERLERLVAAGISPESIVLDPGIGFGKTHEQTLAQLRHLDTIAALNRPVLLGVSRKGFIGIITGRERHERLAGTLAVNCYCAAQGTTHILRVHDVAATVDAAKIIGAIRG